MSLLDPLGHHTAWDQLYEEPSWKPPTEAALGRSATMQRAHFAAFFAARAGLRHPVAPGVALRDVLALVLDGLHMAKAGAVWLRFYRALKAHLNITRQLFMLCRRSRAERLESLESWLAYWRGCEAQGKEKLRSHLITSKRPQTNGNLALTHAMSNTPEDTKTLVLWELYWLLRTQSNALLIVYWGQWFELLARRRRILQRPPLRGAEDFNVHNQPATLRGVNAALFIHALRRPKVRFAAGRDVRLAELLRLATAPFVPLMGLDSNGNPIRQVSPVVSAFQQSSLCKRRSWLLSRLQQPEPLIPRRSWYPEASQPLPSPGRDHRSVSGLPLQSNSGEGSGPGRPLEHVTVLDQRRRGLRVASLESDGLSPASPQRPTCPLSPVISRRSFTRPRALSHEKDGRTRSPLTASPMPSRRRNPSAVPLQSVDPASPRGRLPPPTHTPPNETSTPAEAPLHLYKAGTLPNLRRGAAKDP
eukprot:EG_transcript_4952